MKSQVQIKIDELLAQVKDLENQLQEIRTSSAQEGILVLEQDLPVNSVITLPNGLQYPVGKNLLRVSYDGISLSPTYFEEVGTVGEMSSEVKLLMPFKQGQELDFWVSAPTPPRVKGVNTGPSGGNYDGFNYSLEETVIGTWVDGKPLYRKVWKDRSYVASGALSSAISVADLNVDTGVRVEGMRDAGTGWFPVGGNAYLFYNDTNNTINSGTIRGAGSINAGKYKLIIFEYTKTTD